MKVNYKAYVEGLHYSKDFERVTLGAALLEKPALAHVLALRPEYFYVDAYRTVYMAMQDLARAGQPVDCLTVWQYLATKGVKQLGGMPASYFICNLTNIVMVGAHVPY